MNRVQRQVEIRHRKATSDKYENTDKPVG